MKPKVVREPFRLFYKCDCGEMIPKTLLMLDGKYIPDTKSRFKSCYNCGRNMRRLGVTTARRTITTTRYGFLWLKVKKEMTFEYPGDNNTPVIDEEPEVQPKRIITLDQVR